LAEDNKCGSKTKLVRLVNLCEFSQALDLTSLVFSELHLRISVGLYGNWMGDKLITQIDGVTVSEVTSTSKSDHSQNLCMLDKEYPDRFVLLTIKVNKFEYKDALNIKITSTNGDFGVYDISTAIFEVCPTNFNLINSKCECAEGYFKEPIPNCFNKVYNSLLCWKCTPCPAFCKQCDNEQTCKICADSMIIKDGRCQPEGGNLSYLLNIVLSTFELL
jgi:hypothetical protein